MDLEEKVRLLEKKLAALYSIVNASKPSMDLIREMEERGFNSSMEDS